MSSPASAKRNEDVNILAELKKISKILVFSNSKVIEEEIGRIANSDARKKMWVLIDGNRMPKDIAEKTGLSTMAVSYFLDSASAAGIVEYAQRKPPQKLLDYVPPSWISLVVTEEAVDTLKNKGAADSKASTTKQPNQVKKPEGAINE
jgi:translation initiation factor 2B subunit (eIF-2B alpha/beta/delta family)